MLILWQLMILLYTCCGVPKREVLVDIKLRIFSLTETWFHGFCQGYSEVTLMSPFFVIFGRNNPKCPKDAEEAVPDPKPTIYNLIS